MIASLYLRTTRASCIDFGIATEDMLVVKALKELNNLWYDTYLKIGCMVQDLVPFLRATGISRSLEAVFLKALVGRALRRALRRGAAKTR